MSQNSLQNDLIVCMKKPEKKYGDFRRKHISQTWEF